MRSRSGGRKSEASYSVFATLKVYGRWQGHSSWEDLLPSVHFRLGGVFIWIISNLPMASISNEDQGLPHVTDAVNLVATLVMRSTQVGPTSYRRGIEIRDSVSLD